MQVIFLLIFSTCIVDNLSVIKTKIIKKISLKNIMSKPEFYLNKNHLSHKDIIALAIERNIDVPISATSMRLLKRTIAQNELNTGELNASRSSEMSQGDSSRIVYGKFGIFGEFYYNSSHQFSKCKYLCFFFKN